MRSTSYDLSVVATDPTTGGREIYDAGPMSTLNLPDLSGWYMVPSMPAGFSSIDPGFSAGPVFAGSPAGSVLMGLPGLVTDGTIPTVSPSGAFDIYYSQDLKYFSYESANIQSSLETERGTANGRGGRPNPTASTDPIDYFDGAVDYSTTDLESDGLGSSFTQSRSWTAESQLTVSDPGAAAPSLGERNGNGWISDSVPMLQQSVQRQQHLGHPLGHGRGNLRAIRRAIRAHQLQRRHAGPQRQLPRMGRLAGQRSHVQRLYATPAHGLPGQFVSMTDAGGIKTCASAWSTNPASLGAITEIDRYDATGTVVLETWTYTYIPSSAEYNAGLISEVQLWRGDDLVQQVLYAYYDGTYLGDDRYGNLGDLKTAAIEDAAGGILSTDYYRYYTPYDLIDPSSGEQIGYIGGLKYVFDAASYAALVGSGVTDPAGAADAAVAPYAEHYFQYDQERRVTLHSVQGAGATAGIGVAATGGIGTFTYTYAANASYYDNTTNPSDGTNCWDYETTETLPDGNENFVYCNFLGEAILNDFYDKSDPSNVALSGDHWKTFYQYNPAGQVVMEAEPSAVIDYDTTYPDLNVIEKYLDADSGVINLTDYYAAPNTATADTAGGVAGFFEDSMIQVGGTGTPILQETKDYYCATSGGSTNVVEADDTVYRNDHGSGGEKTSYTYSHWDLVRPEWVTTSLPVVPDGTTSGTVDENGSNSANTSTTVYDQYGRVILDERCQRLHHLYGLRQPDRRRR